MNAAEARALMRSEMTERQLLEHVRELAGRLHWLCYHTHDSRLSEPGFPDLVLCRGGRLLFVELKSDRGEVSREQQRWLDALDTCGASAQVWRPADLDDIFEELR